MTVSSPRDRKRKASLGSSHVRLVGRMVAKGHTPQYAERIFKRIGRMIHLHAGRPHARRLDG
jgi:hypothetical protein